MDIRESTFRRAALMLSTIGAEFAIVYQGKLHTSGECKFAMLTKDGTLYNNELEVVTKKLKTKFVKVHDFKATGYLDVLPLLANGESWSYTCEGKELATALQRACTGWASRNWGNKNYVSCVRDEKVFEILRLQNEQTV